MASLNNFEKILREVVQAKRLSASKMTRLTEIALQSMEDDTQLVSILYRTHKSLPPAAKVASLYVFDALSRAARNQVVKLGLTGDAHSLKGNCVTFLLKIEGVLEGLFHDMIMIGNPEAKEKTRKILDIWVKGNTFPSAVLSRLTEVVKETDKEHQVTPPITAPTPQIIPQPLPPPPPSLAAPPPAIPDPQATLLALLTQAAQAVTIPNGQTATNTAVTAGPSQLDPAQLALLQQLTQTAKLGVAPPPVHPAPVAPASVTPPLFSAPTGNASPPSTSYRDDPRNPGSRREFHDNRFNSPDRGRPSDDYDDPRNSFRGGFRGGFRGRARGDGRSKWDERDRFRDRRDRSPPRRGSRRSRSRSPPSRHGGRRDIRPYSPPRRPSLAAASATEQTRNSPGHNEPEKDEFGRDIRPQSPDDTDGASATPAQTSPAEAIASSVEPASAPAAVTHNQMSMSPSVAANTSSQTAGAEPSSTTPDEPGIAQFDPTTFDFTAPSSWEALGKMWRVTYGHLPSTEELMQFVSGAMVAAPVASQSNPATRGWSDPSWSHSGSNVPRGRGRGRGSFQRGGRGSYGHGNGRDTQEQWGYGDAGNDTDAIVLGGDTDSVSMDTSVPSSNPIPASSDGQGSGGLGGKMQRVGEKWVFVRDEAPPV